MQSSLRDQFFQAVDYELGRRFRPQDIQRVLKFAQTCKAGVVPPEAPALPYFQPSEEYVEGLTAMPWHDPYSFPWVKALEEGSPIIQEELSKVRGSIFFITSHMGLYVPLHGSSFHTFTTCTPLFCLLFFFFFSWN